MKRLRHRRAGYTLIEVMVAVAISAIGISGIVFMQSATVRSNQDAHETQLATAFARTWVDRIRRDALLWTAPGLPPAAVMFAGRNLALANSASYFVPTLANTDTWAVPIPLTGAPESAGSNYHGVDVGAVDRAVPFTNPPTAPRAVTNADIYYCANTKFVQVHVNSLGQDMAVRATVRVWWNRKASLNEADYTPGLLAVRAGGCERFVPTSAQLQDPQGRFRVVYLSTIVSWTSP